MHRKAISGLYAVTPDLDDTPRLMALVEAVLQGGARIVQYRNKPASAVLRREQAAALLPICRAFDVPLIINDHVDLCRELGAEGVHLGGEDGSIAAVRALLGPNKIVGASCYNRIELAMNARAQGADYVAFGACFSSSTKPAAPSASLALFEQTRQQVGLPAVAIGGITAENAPLVIQSGADALAVINAIFTAPQPEQAARVFSNLFIR
jgi:thiamine-phosphate pyrophosphorylase